MRALAAIALTAAFAAPQEEGDERTLVSREFEGEIPRKWEAAEEAKDWRARLDLFTVAQRDYREKLWQPDADVGRWLRLPEVLARRLREAPDAVREPSEIVAKQIIEAAEDRGTKTEAIERYAFTRAAFQAREALAHHDFDQGRVRDAVRGWSLALDAQFSAESVARLGHAHALLGDGPALAALRGHARTEGWKGEVAIQGRRVQLLEYLDSLRPAESPAPPPLFKPAAAPSNEILLGRFEFSREEGGLYGRGQAGSTAGWASVGGKEYLYVGNGLRLLAIDPARAEGGPLDEAVEWRFPKDGTTRSMPTHSLAAQPVAQSGIAVSGDRIFATMFTRQPQEEKQKLPDRRRYSTRFEGPGAIRAFRADTGELLWDTETLESESAGDRKSVFDDVLGGSFNFCFAGPPLVRGDRLYAAIMTSPYVGRYCWAICLNANDGMPIWCTPIGKAPAKREIVSVPTIAEEDGTLAVLTNFGIAAALDSRTGRIEWLVKYRDSGGFARRTVNPPVLMGSVVLFLAQDAERLLAYDRWTGREAPLADLEGEVSWPGVAQLVGKRGDWIVLTGAKSYAVRPSDGKTLCLLDLEATRHGRGTMAGGLLYLPGRLALHLYDTREWKPIGSLPWPEGDETGNLLVTDSLMVWLGDRLELYTSRAALGERLSDRLKAGHPQSSRQMGRILEASNRPREAVLYYRKALAVWEKDAAWTETAEGLRKRIADLQEKIDAAPPK